MFLNLTKNKNKTPAPGNKKLDWVDYLVLVLIGTVIIVGLVMWYLHYTALAAYDSLISTESMKYTNPTETADMLRTAIQEILDNKSESALATDYSTTMDVNYQTAVLDMAVAKLKALGWITPIVSTNP